MKSKRIAIIGVDPSSKKLASVSSIVGKEIKAKPRRRVLPQNKPEACHLAYKWIQRVISLQEGVLPDEIYVFVELPVMGRGGIGSTLPQAQINGAVLAGAYAMGVNVIPVNNMTVKKQVIGKGNAGKDEVKAWVAKCWRGLYKKIQDDQDLCDSAMIYTYGKGVVEMRERIHKTKSLGDKVSVKKKTKITEME